MLVTWILAWLHVLFAVSWLGGGIVFAFVVAPALARLSPSGSGEFTVKVLPSVIRFFQATAGLTIVFGLALLFNMGGQSLLSPSNTYGLTLSLGVTFALAAFVVSEFLGAPALLKVVRMARAALTSPTHTPPPEFPRALRWADLTGRSTVLLLLIALVFMVGAGFY